jgi:hypothetical protein
MHQEASEEGVHLCSLLREHPGKRLSGGFVPLPNDRALGFAARLPSEVTAIRRAAMAGWVISPSSGRRHQRLPCAAPKANSMSDSITRGKDAIPGAATDNANSAGSDLRAGKTF